MEVRNIEELMEKIEEVRKAQKEFSTFSQNK